jgi:hypothetical protein
MVIGARPRRHSPGSVRRPQAQQWGDVARLRPPRGCAAPRLDCPGAAQLLPATFSPATEVSETTSPGPYLYGRASSPEHPGEPNGRVTIPKMSSGPVAERHRQNKPAKSHRAQEKVHRCVPNAPRFDLTSYTGPVNSDRLPTQRDVRPAWCDRGGVVGGRSRARVPYALRPQGRELVWAVALLVMSRNGVLWTLLY